MPEGFYAHNFVSDENIVILAGKFEQSRWSVEAIFKVKMVNDFLITD